MPKERDPSNRDDVSKNEEEDLQADAASENAIEETLEESFPASDPPSWAPSRSGPPKDREREADGR